MKEGNQLIKGALVLEEEEEEEGLEALRMKNIFKEIQNKMATKVERDDLERTVERKMHA